MIKREEFIQRLVNNGENSFATKKDARAYTDIFIEVL